MPIIRLTIVLVFLASIVLLALYIITRNKRYLTLLKRMLTYVGWLFIVLFLLFLIARVIRLA